jgi:hypothetical protein
MPTDDLIICGGTPGGLIRGPRRAAMLEAAE